MSSPRHAHAGAGLRLLRAAVFTAVCVVLSGTGHVLAACEAVPLWSLGLGCAVVFALVVPFTGRQRSLPAIAAVLAGGQLALHALFGLAQTRLQLARSADDALIRVAAKLVCGAGPASIGPADARRIVTTAGIDPAAAVHGAHAHPAAGADLPSLAMVLGHLAAAAVTGLLMRRGDMALLRLTQLSAGSAHEVADGALLRALRAALALVRALRAGLPGTPAGVLGRPAAQAGPPPPVAGEALQHTVIRRGPPPVYVIAA
ncbi:hypothetical protein [Streptomyces sp. t39]|uniref:hypothetical protein n=1 Tax=Streptomyces sp. t39 TaxID=1828156 RepID=UPI0011CD4036|nr:hypothetical protein [Streptomyces sp. t39]TXS55912.1 hypothetical protein EAO77_07015 [Streptomyces sp. t39]